MVLNLSDAPNVNTVLGNGSGTSSIGQANTGVGVDSLASGTSGANSNSWLGYRCLNAVTSGSGNTAIGEASLVTVITGANNTCVGVSSGGNYTSSESNNICLGSPGVISESNTLRIGIQGSGTGQQNRCFVAGIVGTTSTGNNVIVSSSGQLTSGGIGTNPSQPAFSANNAAATAVTGDGTAYTIGSTQTAWTKIYDQASNFNTNGTFTAPVTGIYHFTGSVGLTGIDATNTGVVPQIVTSNRSYTGFTIAPFPIVISGALVLNFSCDADMDAADTAVFQVTVFGSTKNVNIQGIAANTFFQGRLVC